MSIVIDHYFTIGSSHDVCEDYCTSGYISARNSFNNSEIQYGILSDGCSSQLDTDIGARLLVRNFEYLLHDQVFQQNVIQKPSSALECFIQNTRYKTEAFISKNVLDCTFLCFLINRNKCYILLVGDGCIFLQKNDGDLELSIVDYDNNAPVYLNYSQVSNFSQIYKSTYGNWKCICTEYSSGKNKLEHKEDKIIEDDKLLSIPIFTKTVDFENYKAIMMTSDGAQSFLKGSMLVNVEDLARILLTLPKNLVLNFMKNHMKNVKRKCNTEGWYHHDDLSIIIGAKQ